MGDVRGQMDMNIMKLAGAKDMLVQGIDPVCLGNGSNPVFYRLANVGQGGPGVPDVQGPGRMLKLSCQRKKV